MKAFDRWFLYDDDHVIAHYASAEMAYEHRNGIIENEYISGRSTLYVMRVSFPGKHAAKLPPIPRETEDK